MADQLATIKIRRDVASNWADADPVLAAGELGIVTDTREAKLGDGFTVFSALPVWLQDVSIAADLLAQLNTALADHIDDTNIHYADAPEDGKPYVRQSGDWSEMEVVDPLPEGNPGDTLRVGDDRNWESTDVVRVMPDTGFVGIDGDPIGKLSVRAGGRFVTIGDSGTANVPVIKSTNISGEAKGFLRYDAYAHYFWTNKDSNGSSMLLDQSGSLIIGGSAGTSARLSVYAGSSDSSNYSAIFRNSAGDMLLGVRGDGNVYAAPIYSQTTSSAANLAMNSSGRFMRSTSSRRYKREIKNMPYGLKEALQLRPVTYMGTGDEDGDTVHGGLIAEEVHDAGLTDFVEYNEENEPEALEYGNMVALAFKAIQELNDKVETLMARLEPNQKDPKNA